MKEQFMHVTKLTLALVVFLAICTIQPAIVSAQTEPWLDNPVDYLITNDWFVKSAYGDCHRTTCGVWPVGRDIDCILRDNKHPKWWDTMIVPEPPDLFYKHLTPAGEDTGNSVVVGLEGGRCGTMLRSITIMVHPRNELPIVEQIGVAARVQQFYQPFVEGAIGASIVTEDLIPLYEAALYHCKDGTGRGTLQVFGNYVVVVQHWEPLKDCQIHVVPEAPNPNPLFTATLYPAR